MTSGAVANIGIEEESARGWSYQVGIQWPNGATSEHVLTLSWSDHERIAGGHVRPSEVAAAAIDLLLHSDLEAFDQGSLPLRLDVSTLRRRIPEFDEQVRPRLGGASRSDR